MKSKNSSGHDEISSKMLKIISNSPAKPLTLLINQCLYTWIFPDNMKLAKAISIHKKGDISDMTNYRPISLHPSISKNIEKVAYFLEHNLIYKHQYGFRPNHSTELYSATYNRRNYNRFRFRTDSIKYILRPLKSIRNIRPQHINPQTTILRYTQHRIKLLQKLPTK